MLVIDAGAQIITAYKNQRIVVYGQPVGSKLTMISATSNGVVTGYARQLVKDMGDSKYSYPAKMNANYFAMSNGMALGVRCGIQEWNVPRQNAYCAYYLKNDGTTDVCMDNDFWYARGEVQMACSPAMVLMLHGKQSGWTSPNTAGTKSRPNTQSVLLKTKDRFAFAICQGKLMPNDIYSWAKTIKDIEDVCLFDSGGSTQLTIGSDVYYGTSERRKVANALAFYTKKSAPVTPSNNTITLYTVQVGAFRVKSNAETIKKKLADKGFKGGFITYDGKYYRVQVGVFKYKKNADAYAEKLKEAGFPTLIKTK